MPMLKGGELTSPLFFFNLNKTFGNPQVLKFKGHVHGRAVAFRG